MKNTVKLKFLGKIYTLKVLESEYLNNNKPYLGLVNPKTGEYFSDITVNLPGLDYLKGYNFIDPDFIELCFSYIGDLENRLKENLNIKEFHKHGDYYYFTF